MDNEVNVVLVGDSQVGKTNLLFSYAENGFNNKYRPTVFDHYQLGDISYEDG
jgi:GTPase SAR1 family protein